MNDNVPSRGDLLSVRPDDFPNAAPDAISPHRSAQSFLDAPSEPAEVQAIGAEKNREFPARFPAPFAVHRVIFSAAHQSARPGQTQPRQVRRV